MIVSGMTMTARHFQGRLIVVPSSPASASAIVRPPGLAPCAASCQPQIRTLQGLKVSRQLGDIWEDVSYNEIREKCSDGRQHGRGRTGRPGSRERNETEGVYPSLWVKSDTSASLVSSYF